MKKKSMILSIGLIMICCVACGKHQQVSLQEQLKIMAENMNVWKTSYSVDMYYDRFTVTDLDENNRYELIIAQEAGSGRYTDGFIYEVNETYDGLTLCTRAEVPEYFGMVNADGAWADFIIDKTQRYYSSSEDVYYYIFNDYVRYNTDECYDTLLAYSLQNGKIHEVPIAALEVLYDEAGERKVTYWNGKGEKISETEYRKIINDPFPLLEAENIEFSWGFNDNLCKISETEFLKELKGLCTEEEKIEETARSGDENEEQFPLVITPSVEGYINFALESEDIFCVCLDEMYGYINSSGEELSGYIYEIAYPFSEGLGCVRLDGKYGYIDINGEIVLPFVYDDAAPFREGLAYFVKDGNYGFMKPDGSVAFYLGCDSVSSFSEGVAYFSENGKYGYLNSRGRVVIEPQYSDADYFLNGVAFVALDGYKGAIDKEGKSIIPIEYDNLSREGNAVIVAERGEEIDYYDFAGGMISQAAYDEYISQESSESKCDFSVSYDRDAERFIVFDENNSEIVNVVCDSAICHVYEEYENYVIKNYSDEEKDKIVVLEDCQDEDILGALLKHAITPRKEAYWQIINTEWSCGSIWGEDIFIKRTKLYDIDGTGEGILYCYEAPCVRMGFPLSYSAFYTMDGEDAERILQAEECGGSMRGDYICFWRDTESDKVFLGREGTAGGFGGYAWYGTVYDYENGKLVERFSYEWIGQIKGNYNDEELLEKPHLFYDEEDAPYTKETIGEAEWATAHYINDEMVTMEEFYAAISQYVQIELFN